MRLVNNLCTSACAQELVSSIITFSRCLYAQLEAQVFEPPKGYPALPPPESRAYRQASLGMKLAVRAGDGVPAVGAPSQHQRWRA